VGHSIAHLKEFAEEGNCDGIESFGDSLIEGYHTPTPRRVILSEGRVVLNSVTSNSPGIN